MRSRGSPILRWSHHGSCCLYRLSVPGRSQTPLRSYSTVSPPDPTPPERGGAEVAKERSLAALKHAGLLGREWSRRSSQVATEMVNYWWARYEEFVGLNEVREAQARVNEAETSFMVSRGQVQEAQASLDSVHVKLKEVRTRLDRVSREEPHYLELATLEHKLLQEERRECAVHGGAEVSERQRFTLFSAAVRSSHEKERTRAERTKNWSLIGSLLGTVIGVMGSTYINRVRLQELKVLLLEAQKGPESLQEVLRVQAGDHFNQQGELQALIDSLRGAVGHITPSHALRTPPTDGPLAIPQPHLAHLEEGVSKLEKGVVGLEKAISRVEEDLSRLEGGVAQFEGGVAQFEGGVAVFKSVVGEEEEKRRSRKSSSSRRVVPSRLEGAAEEEVLRRIKEAREQLEEVVQRSSVMNSAVSVVAAAITVPLLYFLLRAAS